MSGGRINARARWAYNALDCAATIGAFRALEPQLTEPTRMVYRAEMALEACTLAIQSRGIKIDTEVRKALLKELRGRFSAKCLEINAEAGEAVNPNSPMQVKKLFYGTLGLRETRNKDGKISTDDSVLERIAKCRIELEVPRPRGEKMPHLEHCATIAKLIQAARSINKDSGMVKAALDAGRMRTSINVGATESFRFSASKTSFGRGANLQQVKHDLRAMFIPDEGMEIVYGDQDRAESTVVAHVSGDVDYIAAHRAHDTHVEVAKLIWPDAGWTGEDDADLTLAEQPNFIRFYSRRDMSKRTQHALNYYPPPEKDWTLKGTGPHHTLARMLGIKVLDAYNIANQYFEAFPGIRRWQQSVIDQVKQYQRIYYPGGFYRDFFGRPWDAGTHREAISSIPQAVVAWTNHLIMYKIWKELEKVGELEVLMHNHDAILLQVVPEKWLDYKSDIDALCTSIVWEGAHDAFSIPWSWAIGRNWREVS